MSTHKIITGTVVADDAQIRGQRPAAERALEGESVSFAEMEAQYRKPGGTLMEAWFGADPFDFWFGRFYVGTFGVMSLIGIFFGTILYFYQAWIVEGQFNLLAARLDPPPVSEGLRLMGANEPGFFWQIIVIFATIAFFGWALRQVDISRKLGMSYEIPIAYFAVVTSWLTLQIFRPVAMGAWGNGFSLGITHHLDWVSNIGYQYFNFFYNPFHAIGISLLFLSTFILALHGSIILMTSNRPNVSEENEDGFWRSIQGYSIGEIGIHRLALWVGIFSVLFSNLCIFLSGTLVHDWVGIWAFWDQLPIWEGIGVASVAIIGTVIWRRRSSRSELRDVDPEEQEYSGNGIESPVLKDPVEIGFMERLFDLGQIGPIYLGFWGLISVGAGILASFVILEAYMYEVDYNIVGFLQHIFVLTVDPPAMEYGLGLVTDLPFMEGWHAGNDWIFATTLLNVAVLAWAVRIWRRADNAGLGQQLFWSFWAALFLYFVIYLIRPVIMGNWAQAPGQGFKAVLDWTNNVSVQYGNFYYNPFHMLSIFFLLGSTLLLAMHGGTIVASSKYGSYREVEEMMTEGSGTQRAQLFWRWCMGWQATSRTIHTWCLWFAAFTGITGGIGLLLTGTGLPFAQNDWFAWAMEIGIVAPLP
jgi:photosynthetic reaction center M subunit/photosynthetic reaction center L subunit